MVLWKYTSISHRPLRSDEHDGVVYLHLFHGFHNLRVCAPVAVRVDSQQTRYVRCETQAKAGYEDHGKVTFHSALIDDTEEVVGNIWHGGDSTCGEQNEGCR